MKSVATYQELPLNGPVDKTQVYYIENWDKYSMWVEEVKDWQLFELDAFKRRLEDQSNDRRGAIRAQKRKGRRGES